MDTRIKSGHDAETVESPLYKQSLERTIFTAQKDERPFKEAGGEALKPNDVTPAQLLDGALKKGATASVCALYLPNSGKQPADLKDGIKPAKPAEMGAALLEPNRKVIGF